MRYHRWHVTIVFICIIVLYWQLSFFDGTTFLSVNSSKEILQANHQSTSNITNTTNITTVVKLKCFLWETENSDNWATHHPTWEVTIQNDTHLCFERIDTWRTQFLQKIYENQWYGNCSHVFTDYMWSSGWGADTSNVANGLLTGFMTHRPFQIGFINPERPWWHYSAMKNGEAPVCPTMDMFCYFLPLSNCSVGTIQRHHQLPGNQDLPDNEEIDDEYYRSTWPNRPRARLFWLQKYAFRPQQRLWKQLYDFIHQNATNIHPPCTAIHVRRSDVVLHDKSSRKYFPVSNYVQKIPKDNSNNNNIFLMTDDANAIDEALEFHPNLNWMYLKRKRHRGSEGGWENQIPSKNPALEVLYLLAEIELAKQCDVLIYGKSSFADWILFEMKSRDKNTQGIRVDDTDLDMVHHPNNTLSEQELNQTLNQWRKDRNTSKNNQN